MNNKYLFECSWEVCNKVGGIYTVITTKVQEAIEKFGDHYITIGPKLNRNPGFLAETSPASEDEGSAGNGAEAIDIFGKAMERLADRKIYLELGRWDIAGKPRSMLVNFAEAFPQKDKLLYELWTDYGVDSMFGTWDYLEPVLFSTACGIVIAEIAKDLGENHERQEIYAHFHEWMTGAGLLYLKKHHPSISTVFTTHATMLGRAMSGAGIDIYAKIGEINPWEEAKRHNISAKHSMEMVCAREADCFTTVSELLKEESSAFLGTSPALVTPNGFNVEDIPEYQELSRKSLESRAKLLEFSSLFLGKELKPETTKLFVTSGRYEFHNKGIDILLESLAQQNLELKVKNEKNLNIVALILVIGGYVGVGDEARARFKHLQTGLEKYSGIATHHLGDPHNDPIVKFCQRLNLMNNPENAVNIIFIPVYLDGNDGILNMEYYEVLRGCDLGIFASYYEPWGYTSLESAAFAVPSITSNRSGFGKWVEKNASLDASSGIFVLPRLHQSDPEVIKSLTEKLSEISNLNEDEIGKLKTNAYQIAKMTSWNNFYSFYRQAYDKATTVRYEREIGLVKKREALDYQISYAGTNSTQPRLRSFSVVTDLPTEINKLRDIAYNLYWTWNYRAQELFRRLDPLLWRKLYHNPVALLDTIEVDKLRTLIDNKNFMALYKDVAEEFENYCKESSKIKFNPKEITPQSPVAYFSMEFGLHEALITYSGGLGVLSGDHIKSASDLNLPFVGVSLLYKYGYFKQRINSKGEQISLYEDSNFAQLPIQNIETEPGKKLLITLNLPGREVFAQVWEAKVGRSRLLFLDTDIEENARSDRNITSRLYEPTSRERIEQEMLIGIGGARLLQALQIKPSVFHLNEGHSAFLLIEQVKQLMASKGLDFYTAKEMVKASTVFTMHTPVPAGNERFDKSLVENYFRTYVQEMGIGWEEFWNLGHVYAEDAANFTMPVLAIKLSNMSNGVSRLHGEVSRKMWQEIWPGFLLDEVPIDSITNGVHVASWMAKEIRDLIETFAGFSIEKAQMDSKVCKKIDDIPNTNFQQTHNQLKGLLFERIKESVKETWLREGESSEILERFNSRIDPSALTIVFARRFATYKRPTLIFRDFERLRRIIKNENRPVQLVFTGKAHPADKQGADLIKQIVQLSKNEEFLGKVIFLENYDIRIARTLTAGADVWLNNPLRPMEASGTSGMKAALNGVLNCSILDGWWMEGYDQENENGWAIGSGQVFENSETQDIVDSESLYSLLEEKIIPLYYDHRDIWIKLSKNAIKSVLPAFNTNRMVKEYIDKMYQPTAVRAKTLAKDDYKLARELAEWKKKIAARFSTVHIQEVRMEGLHGDEVKLGSPLKIYVTVNSGNTTEEEILTELVIIPEDGKYTESCCGRLVTAPLKFTHKEDNILHYETFFVPDKTGNCKYGVRVLPNHPALSSKYETGLVFWS